MKKILMLVLCLGAALVADSNLVITQTDVFIAEAVCADKNGVKELEVGGYFTCNNNESGDESKLLELSNIYVLSTLSK